MNYEWITDEMFDGKLNTILKDEFQSTKEDLLGFLVRMGNEHGYDLYEPLKETFNNEVLEKLEEDHPLYYEDVFFAQGEEAEEWLDKIDKEGTDPVLDKLLNDAWQPGSHMTRDEEPWGDRDYKISKWLDKKRDMQAILSYNTRIGYVGLTVTGRKVEWISCEKELPPFNQLVIAWLDGWKEHSGLIWGRNGYAFMVRHNDDAPHTLANGWSLSHYKEAIKNMGADFAFVTHWHPLLPPPNK